MDLILYLLLLKGNKKQKKHIKNSSLGLVSIHFVFNQTLVQKENLNKMQNR